MKFRPLICAFTALVLLSGCSGNKADADKPDGDPAQAGALADPIMTDPDLTSQNKAEAAIAGGGPPVIELPEVERGAEAIAAARAEAEKLVDGTIQPAPSARAADVAGADAVTPAQLAALVRGGPEGRNACAGKLGYSASWALRLPEPLAIYPRGHLREAAGIQGGGCDLAIASFVTPVDLPGVLDFYYTRLKLAGYSGEHLVSRGMDILAGTKGSAAYAIRARKRDDGLTLVDLVFSRLTSVRHQPAPPPGHP